MITFTTVALCWQVTIYN